MRAAREIDRNVQPVFPPSQLSEEHVSRHVAGGDSRVRADRTRDAVLIVGDDHQHRSVLDQVLHDWKLRVVHCSTFREALHILSHDSILLAFCDLGGSGSGFDGLMQLIDLEQHARIVAIVPEIMGDGAYRAVMQMGAFNVIASPCRRSDVQWSILFALREEGRSNTIEFDR